MARLAQDLPLSTFLPVFCTYSPKCPPNCGDASPLASRDPHTVLRASVEPEDLATHPNIKKPVQSSQVRSPGMGVVTVVM
jgi:hypothetical protein